MSWSKKDYCLTAFVICLACIPALYFHPDNTEFLQKISCSNLESNLADFVEAISPYLSSDSGGVISNPVRKEDVITNASNPPPQEHPLASPEIPGVQASSYLVDKAEQDEDILVASRFCRGPVAEQSRHRRRRIASPLRVGYLDADMSQCEDNPDCGKHKKKGMMLAGAPVASESKSGCSKRRRRVEMEVDAHAAESKGRGKRRRRRSTASEEAIAVVSKSACSKNRGRRRRRSAAETQEIAAENAIESNIGYSDIPESIAEVAIALESKSGCSRKRRRRLEVPEEQRLLAESRAAKRRRPRRINDLEGDAEDDEGEENEESLVASKYEEMAAPSMDEVGVAAEEGVKLEFCDIMDIFTNNDADTQYKAIENDASPEVEEEEDVESAGEITLASEVPNDDGMVDEDDSADEAMEVESKEKDEADEDDEEEDDEEVGQQIAYMGTPPMYA